MLGKGWAGVGGRAGEGAADGVGEGLWRGWLFILREPPRLRKHIIVP